MTVSTSTYSHLHKVNTGKPLTGICRYCFEDSIFRVVQLHKINSLVCTRCRRSARLYKVSKARYNRMLLRRPLDRLQKFERIFKRIHMYFKGNHVFYPFRIKRKSMLGFKITILIIKLRGLRNG